MICLQYTVLEPILPGALSNRPWLRRQKSLSVYQAVKGCVDPAGFGWFTLNMGEGFIRSDVPLWINEFLVLFEGLHIIEAVLIAHGDKRIILFSGCI